MNTDMVVVAAIAAGGGILGGAGVAEVVKGMFGRKPKTTVTVENEVKLAQEAANQAKQSAAFAAQMQASAQAAWTQAHAAEERVGDAEERVSAMERKADEVQFKLDVAARYVVWLLDLIGEPSMTMESLRGSVARHRPPAAVMNGRNVNGS